MLWIPHDFLTFYKGYPLEFIDFHQHFTRGTLMISSGVISFPYILQGVRLRISGDFIGFHCILQEAPLRISHDFLTFYKGHPLALHRIS